MFLQSSHVHMASYVVSFDLGSGETPLNQFGLHAGSQGSNCDWQMRKLRLPVL